MSPLERIARLLEEMNPEAFSPAGVDEWKAYIPDAKRILEAIREPSQDYVNQVVRSSEDVIAWGDYREFWQAMIDAALAEATK